MAYSKMTVADFKKKLKAGEYADATGARRGAGKTGMPDAEKAKCYRAIDKHFGKTPKKPAKKTAGRKAGKKPAKKAAKKKAAGKKAAGKGGDSKANGAAKPAKAKPRGKAAAGKPKGKARGAKASAGDAEALSALGLANERIGTIVQAIAAMKQAKEAYPELDTKEGATAAGAALTDILQGVHKTVKGEQLIIDPEVMDPPDPAVVATLAKTAAASQGLPGHESPVVRTPDNSSPETKVTGL